MAYLGFVLVLIFAFAVNTSLALRCWSCSSDVDPQCGDYFNATRLIQMRSYSQQRFQPNYNSGRRDDSPNLVECSTDFSQQYNQKQVCVKRVINVPYGKKFITRECKTVPTHQAVGTCMNRNSQEEFCETCEYDGCNGAYGVSASYLAALLPAVTLLFVRR